MKFRRSVTRFIVYSLAIGFILYSGIIITIVKSNLSGGLTKYFNEEVVDQSQVLKDEMQSALDNAFATAKFIQKSYEDIFPDYGFDRTIMNSFAEGAQKYHGAKNIVFFNSFGMQVSSPLFGSIPKNDDVKAALAGSETVKFEKGEGDESNDIFVTVILPLRSEDRTFGVVEIKTPITTEALIESVKDYTNCDISIFSDNVRVLTTIKSMQGTTLDDATIFEDSKNGKPTLITNLINNQKYISYYFPFTDSKGNYLTTLYIGKEMSIASNLTSKIFKPLIGAIVIFTAIFLFYFLFIIHYKVTAPLRKVRKAVSNLSSGDANLTQRLDTSRGDEFADLSGEVNKFIEMLQKIIKELNDSQSSLNEVSLSLGDNAQDSASATAQILANIESVRKQSQNQSEAVQNTSTVLEMSSTSVDVLSDLIEHQTASVTQSSAAIEEMLGNISAVTNSVKKMSTSFGELGNTVDDGKSKLSSVDQKVKQIAEQSKMLIEANKVIAQIASETNLLAMNAAIEAAHAGDSGKGFSVVAEEIRKLAENSGVQAKNISSELKGISDSIQDVVSLSRTSETAFDAIVEQLDSTDMIIQEITNAMEEQQTASKQIFESLSDMKNQSTEVASKAHDMNQGIEKVAKDMNTVSQISSTILGSMDEMTTGMQQIGDATQNVSNLAGQTKDNIEIMSNKLNLFKV